MCCNKKNDICNTKMHWNWCNTECLLKVLWANSKRRYVCHKIDGLKFWWPLLLVHCYICSSITLVFIKITIPSLASLWAHVVSCLQDVSFCHGCVFVSLAIAGKTHRDPFVHYFICSCCLLSVLKNRLTFGSNFYMLWWISTNVGS